MVVIASANLAGPDVRDRVGHEVEVHLHSRSDQVSERSRCTAIGHVQDIDAGHDLEQLTRQMGGRPVAGRCHVEPAGIGLGVCNEFGNRVDWNRGV